MTKKKVLIYGLTAELGGVEKYFLDRLAYLKKEADICFIIPGNGNISFENVLKTENVKIKRIPHLVTPIAYYCAIKNILINGKYDVLYCNLTYANAILYFLAWQLNIKLIVHSHNTSIDAESKKKRILMKAFHYFSRKFSFLIDKEYGCSKDACKWLFGKVNKAKIRKNAIKTELFQYNPETRHRIREELKLKENFTIGHVGRFSFQKNHEFLIRIFSEILKKNETAKLLLIGTGETEQLIRQQIINLGIEKSVYFLGLRNDVPELMQAMDCFVFPSRFEGLGIVGIEAQTSGLKCFFSDVTPRELEITCNVQVISLQDSPGFWAKKILDSGVNMTRKEACAEVVKAGYDLTSQMMNVKFFE